MKTEFLLDKFLSCAGVSIDTRTIRKGELFIALKGPNFDGNAYVKMALEKGAAHVFCEDLAFSEHPQVTIVADGLEALQQVAIAYRQTWDCPVIGLTGSNGKTTTKELLSKMLATTYRVYATEGNLNNHIGVPLSLLRAPVSSEVVIIEMGANHVGEIAELVQLAQPTHGFITNIGRAHLEGFGGLDGVRQGKGELFDYLKQKGQAFINVEDEEIMALSKRAGRCLYFSGNENSSRTSEAQLIFSGKMEESFPVVRGKLLSKGKEESFQSHLPGKYNYQNILVASAVASYFKVTLASIARAIISYIPTNSRSEIREIGASKVLFDVYNANPDSVMAALSWIKSRPESTKVIVLGELAELGAFAKTEHQQVVKSATSIQGSIVAFFGNAYEGVNEGRPVFTEMTLLRNWLSAFMDNADTVILLKGSRSNRLELLLNP